MDNYESLPFRQFTAKSEADKAINSLRGILLGINFDHEINDQELKVIGNLEIQYRKDSTNGQL